MEQAKNNHPIHIAPISNANGYLSKFNSIKGEDVYAWIRIPVFDIFNVWILRLRNNEHFLKVAKRGHGVDVVSRT